MDPSAQAACPAGPGDAVRSPSLRKAYLPLPPSLPHPRPLAGGAQGAQGEHPPLHNSPGLQAGQGKHQSARPVLRWGRHHATACAAGARATARIKRIPFLVFSRHWLQFLLTQG